MPEATIKVYTRAASVSTAAGAGVVVRQSAPVARVVKAVESGPPGPPGSALVQATAASAINGHRAITFDDGGRVRHADCTLPNDSYVFGISLNAANTGENVDVRITGTLEHIGWTFTPGGAIYLGVSGVLVQTLPIDVVLIKRLGVALSATRIQIDLQPTIYL